MEWTCVECGARGVGEILPKSLCIQCQAESVAALAGPAGYRSAVEEKCPWCGTTAPIVSAELPVCAKCAGLIKSRASAPLDWDRLKVVQNRRRAVRESLRQTHSKQRLA